MKTKEFKDNWNNHKYEGLISFQIDEWDLLQMLSDYATQEREKAEAEKKAYAREMVKKFSGEAQVYDFEYFPDDFTEDWLTANGLNEPKPEKP